MTKVLMLTEASYLSTGYAAYGRELIPRLIDAGYDVAEFSVYGTYDDPRRKEIPWKNYPNMPSPNEPEAMEQYRSKPVNQFGAWRFERACIDFQPTHVCDLRDFWMSSFVPDSPYRKHFNFIYMPTVDAQPQANEWINMFKGCDALLTYSDWAEGVLRDQMGNIPYFGSAPMCGAREFHPKNKVDCRDRLGIEPNVKIVGTVMRNQRRKLFDDLFKTFRLYLDKSGDDNTYLYCHTSYPDNGWPLGQFIIEYGLSSKALFTYSCEDCGHTFASFFSDTVRSCTKCGKFTAKTSNVAKGISRDTLADVYNCMDLYVQYHNSEGFAAPTTEAALCGVHVASVDYSAQESVIRDIQGTPLKVKSLYREMETGCYRAVPDNDANSDFLVDFFKKPYPLRSRLGQQCLAACKEKYSWEKSAQSWINAIEACGPKTPWNSPPNIRPELEKEQFPEFHTNEELLRWCFESYLGQPERVGSYQYHMLLRDFNSGMFKPNPGGFFYSDSSISGRQDFRPFSKDLLCDMMTGYVKQHNFWERVRTGQLPLREENWI